MYKGVSIVEALQPGEDCLLLPKGPGRRALGRMLRCFSSEAPGRFLGGTPRGSLQGCGLFPHSSGVSAAAAGNQNLVQHRCL